MHISDEGKIGVALAAVLGLGAGAAVMWPEHREIGLVIMAISAGALILLATNHYYERQKKIFVSIIGAVGILITVLLTWFFWPKSYFNELPIKPTAEVNSPQIKPDFPTIEQIINLAPNIGTPRGDWIPSSGFYIESHQSAVVIWEHSIEKVIKLNDDRGFQYIDDDQKYDNPQALSETFVRKDLKLDPACDVPLGAVYYAYKTRRDWQNMGCRLWRCYQQFGEVYYQAFSNGLVIFGVKKVKEDGSSPRSVILEFGNTRRDINREKFGRWSEVTSVNHTKQCWDPPTYP